MPDVLEFGDFLDSSRIARAKELSDLKTKITNFREDNYGLASKTAILFAYAHWEGFYNECVVGFVSRLAQEEIKVNTCSHLMVVGCMESGIQSMVDRNHSYESKVEFVDVIRSTLDASFKDFDAKCILAKSNLDFEKLRLNFRVLNCDIRPFQLHRNRLDRELVGWRHSIAHGSSPELDSFDLDKHLGLAADLLSTLSGAFQNKMLAIQTALAP